MKKLNIRAASKGTVLVLLASFISVMVQVPAPQASATTALTYDFSLSSTSSIVVLGDLASRSKGQQLTKSGTAAPYTYTGIDARSSASYTYQSRANYTGVQLFESDERVATPNPTSGTFSVADNISHEGKTTLRLTSNGNIAPNASPATSYGSFFGPEIYTEPFDATAGQSINFSWWAQGGSDHYEFYGFLVKIGSSPCAGNVSLGTIADSSIMAYGRGNSSNAWTSVAHSVPENACYRVRFVNGSYDASGGLALGAQFYVADFQFGNTQTLTFDTQDRYVGQSFTPVTSNASGATITLASSTTGVCTVSGSTVTAVATGSCTITANSDSVGGFAAAQTTVGTFNVIEGSPPSTPVRTEIPAPRIPVFQNQNLWVALPGQDLQLQGTRLNCTSNIEINDRPTGFSHTRLQNGLDQLTINIPSNLPQGRHKVEMDTCDGYVTYENLLFVPKPPVVFEAVSRNALERMLVLARLQGFTALHYGEYNHAECIVNASVPSLQTAAREMFRSACRIATMFLTGSAGSTSELRKTHKPANVWLRVTLSNK
jgi:hypothetical protein